MLPDPLLRGTLVRLNALLPEDYATLARWDEDAVYRRLLDSAPAVPRTAETIGRELGALQQAHDAFLFAIRPLEGDDLLGVVDLSEIEWAHGVAWLAIAIGPAYWGRGYGQEALRLLIAFAFRELNLYRLQLTVFAYNTRAIRVYEKLGFRQEGVFRAFLERDGQRHAMLLYGLLRPEWQAQDSDGRAAP